MNGNLLKQLREQNNLTQAEVANATGIKHGTLGRIESQNLEIKKVDQLNALNKLFKIEESSEVSKLNDGSEPPTANAMTMAENAVPVFDVNFSAGTLLNLVELRDIQYPIAWLNIPEVAGCDAVIRARGNSMEPVIRDGDWIAIKQESNWQEWLPKNYIYAISTSTMMLIKYISEITDTHFTIASANEFYKDDVIPKKFIHDVWSVKTVLPFSQIVTLV
jgi:transcriptional regulator with XRE-family HTH domain